MKNLRFKGWAAPLTAAVKVKRQRQRNITLSVHPKTGAVEVRAPRFISKREIDAFLRAQRGWVEDTLSRLPPILPMEDGAEIPFLGQKRVIRHVEGRTRGVTDDGRSLLVGGAAATLAPRLRKWLVAYARRELTMRAQFYATLSNKRIGRIAVRDMHSRWGSCTKTRGDTAGATLGFNWRLVMAPVHVLDYVVAHEVAHLQHMDHSDAFWKLVQKLMGDYEPAERWLDVHGSKLIRVGV